MQSDPHHQGSSVQLLSLYTQCALFQHKSVILGSCCCTVREDPSWLRRSVASCHRGGPVSIPGQCVWFVVDEVVLYQAFFRILSAFRFSVSFHQYSVPIKQPSHSWFMYCDTFIQDVSFYAPTQLRTLCPSRHDSNGRESGCTHLSAVRLNFKRRIKSRLPFAGIIRSSPHSPH